MRKLRLLLWASLVMAVSGVVQSQNYKLTDSLTPDPAVKIGMLENGIVYYIRRNTKPENRIELRLAVNAGSMQETDGQKGLAHFTEHMCFNGTTHFPKNELVDYLQKTGIKFGAGINAYTSFDETVYMLQIPADNPELLENGFQVIEDWAHAVTFEDVEIDKERGVITEEWRQGLGAEDRMRKQYFPIIFNGSRYAERLPIGDIEVIKNFPYDTIRQFYRDWYRPNLQAVIVVGDIDVTEAEKKIIEHFSLLKNPDHPRARVTYDVPDNVEPIIAIVTDKEATSSNIQVFYKHDKRPILTLEDFRNRVLGELYNGMLSERLREEMQKPESPFVNAYNYYGRYLARHSDAYTLVASVKENRITEGLKLMLTESERVKQHGFLQSELNRMKDDLLLRYEKQAKEFDKTESSRFAGQYVSNFLTGTPIAGARAEYEYFRFLTDGIQLAEINALAAKWITPENMNIIITAPEQPEIIMPTQADVLEIIRTAQNQVYDPYIDKFKDEPLLSVELQGSPVATKVGPDANGIVELTLKNGIKVVMKSTDFKNDEILFTASSHGGTSLVSDADYITAIFSPQIISESGLGSFTNMELKKKLKGKNIEINPYIHNVREGLTGRTNPKDFETLLQLTYLYFTAPRKDSAAFSASISRTWNQMKNMTNNPIYAFLDTLTKIGGSNDPRAMVFPKEKQLKSMQLDKLYQLFVDRFSNAGDFTFYFVGNINLDSVTPLIEKYIGSLPVNDNKEAWRDESAPFPEGIVELRYHKGTEPKAMVGIVFEENFEWTDANRLYIRMLKEIAHIKLIETIREEMSGVYSPRIQLSIEKYPVSNFNLMIQFGCSPDNTENLSVAVLSIFEELRTKGPSKTDLKKVKELLIREREMDIKNNRWWLGRMEDKFLLGEDLGDLSKYNSVIEAVKVSELKNAANTFFVKGHYLKGVLLPEK